MLGESYRQRNPRVGDNTTDHIKGKGYQEKMKKAQDQQKCYSNRCRIPL